jgi:hypothetical protein
VLTVAVSSETWKKNIADLAGQILFKLNGALGSSMVSYVEFTVDARYVRARDKPRVPSKSGAEWESLVTSELSPDLERAADEIKDEGLRRKFLRASTSSLARRKLNSERVR